QRELARVAADELALRELLGELAAGAPAVGLRHRVVGGVEPAGQRVLPLDQELGLLGAGRAVGCGHSLTSPGPRSRGGRSRASRSRRCASGRSAPAPPSAPGTRLRSPTG